MLRLVRFEFDDPKLGERLGSIAADRAIFEETVTGQTVVVNRSKRTRDVTVNDLPPLLRRYGVNPLIAARDFDPQDLVGR